MSTAASETSRRSEGERLVLGPWVVDPRLGQIENDGQVVKLEARAMRLLLALAEGCGELVTTDRLLEAIAPGRVVTLSSLYEAVAQVRRMLGKDPSGKTAVASVPRRGYRLAWPVREVQAQSLGEKSLAVLPFRVRGMPAELDFVAERLTGDLISQVSRHGDWTVLARGTMLTFAGSELSPQEVGKQLGARYLVAGSVERDTDELHITVELVDVGSASQTWAETITLPLASWDGAARTVVARLSRALQFGMRQMLSRRAPLPGPQWPQGPQATILASRAWVELFARPENAATNRRAFDCAQAAWDVDRHSALAATCLATCCWRGSQFGWLDGAPAALLDSAIEFAVEAVTLAPDEPDAQYILGLCAYSRGETVRAEESLRHCLELSPSFAPGHGLLALVRTRRGHPEEAPALCSRAFSLSPREPLRAVWHLALAWAALAQEDFRGALEASQRGMAVNPDLATCYLTGAVSAHTLGLQTLASAWVDRLQSRTVFSSRTAVQARMPPATEPAHKQQMLALDRWLQEAGLPP